MGGEYGTLKVDGRGYISLYQEEINNPETGEIFRKSWAGENTCAITVEMHFNYGTRDSRRCCIYLPLRSVPIYRYLQSARIRRKAQERHGLNLTLVQRIRNLWRTCKSVLRNGASDFGMRSETRKRTVCAGEPDLMPEKQPAISESGALQSFHDAELRQFIIQGEVNC